MFIFRVVSDEQINCKINVNSTTYYLMSLKGSFCICIAVAAGFCMKKLGKRKLLSIHPYHLIFDRICYNCSIITASWMIMCTLSAVGILWTRTFIPSVILSIVLPTVVDMLCILIPISCDLFPTQYRYNDSKRIKWCLGLMQILLIGPWQSVWL